MMKKLQIENQKNHHQLVTASMEQESLSISQLDYVCFIAEVLKKYTFLYALRI